jgi:dUTP pyrophosphatase
MTATIGVQVQRIGPIEVPLPRYQTAGAAGMDLQAATAEAVVIPVGGRHIFPTGLAFGIPDGYEGQVRPRSGLAASSGVTVLNAPGTIDSDFRGEVKVVLVNVGQEPVAIAPLQRIAQLVIAPVARAKLLIVDDLPTTLRGSGGYGSTGS